MSSYDEDEDGYKGHGSRGSQSHASVVGSEDDAKRAIEANKKALEKITLKTDSDGNANFFGWKIDKNVLPLVQTGVDQGKHWLLSALDNNRTYRAVAGMLASRFGVKQETANAVAAVADSGARWGIIGVEQVFAVGQASQAYAKRRQELYDFFGPIMQASNISAKNNEVISLAYQRARTEWGENLKDMLTDIPRLAPLIFRGVTQQKAVWEGYEKENLAIAQAGKDPKIAAKEKADAAAAKVMEVYEKAKESQAFIAKKKKEWIKERCSEPRISVDKKPNDFMGMSSDNSQKIRELEKIFDDEMKPLLLEQYFPKNAKKPEELTQKELKEKEEQSSARYHWLSMFGSVASQVWKANWLKSRDKQKIEHVPEMVDVLRKQIANECDGTSKGHKGNCADEAKTADDIQITTGNKTVKLKDYILKMFQQHERDRNPNVDYAKREKDGRIIELVDPMGPALVAKLQPSIDLIAEAIAGGLDPAAMVNLLGGNQIIIHGRGENKTFANENKVRDVLDELMTTMGSREEIKLEEILSKFEKPEDIKKMIEGNLKTMTGQTHACFASLFPDDILKQFGLKVSGIRELRRQAHDDKKGPADMYDFVAANVRYLAGKENEQEGYLKKLGLPEDDIKTLLAMAEKIEAGDREALKTAVNGHDKSLVDAVRTGGLLEQHHGENGKEYWATRMMEMIDVRAKMAYAAKEIAQKEGDEKSEDAHTHEGYEDRDEEAPSPSHAKRVSKKGNSHTESRYAKNDHKHSKSHEHDDDSQDTERKFAGDFEESRGRQNSEHYKRSGGFSKHEYARASEIDNERTL